MTISWVKCQGDIYCPLETVDLSNVNTEGVYIIWHNASARVIYVGQGNIKDRLTVHRSSPEILNHRGSGLLLTTWAVVADYRTRLSIERYLHRFYSPLVSTCAPGPEITVNLPGQ